MLITLLQFSLCGLIITVSGYYLTKFADKIAGLTGLGRMLVGVLLLSASTSLPELMVDLKAVQMNLPDIAVGDLLGSNILNLLILAILDFSFPSDFRRTAFSPAFLHHSLAAVLAIFLTAMVGIGIVAKVDITFLGMSVFSWAILVSYIFGFRLIFKESKEAPISLVKESPQKELTGTRKKKLFFAISGYLVSSAVIFFTAPYLVQLSDEIAKSTKLSHTFVGTTLVALTTSLPELVSTITAFRMGVPDLALGNIFGSSALNMVLFVPLDFMSSINIFNSVATIHAVSAFSIIASLSMAVMGMTYRKKERSRFSEPSSEIIVLMILVFLYLLYKVRSI